MKDMMWLHTIRKERKQVEWNIIFLRTGAGNLLNCMY